MATLVKNSVIYVIGAVLAKGIGFVLIPLYTRYFTVEEYGLLSILNLILQLLTFLLLMGVSSAAMRLYFDERCDEDYRARLYGNAMLILLVSPTLLLLVLGPLMFLGLNDLLPSVPLYPHVLIILILGFLAPIRNLMIGLLRIQKRAKMYVFYYLSFFVVQTLAIIFSVTHLNYGFEGMLVAQMTTQLLFWTIALGILWRKVKPFFSWVLSRRLLAFGVPLIPYFFFSWTNEASARFMLDWYDGLGKVGILALALQISGVLRLAGEAFDKALMPFFYETAVKHNAAELLGQFATKFFGLFGVAMLLAIIIGRPFLLIVAAPRFHEAVLYVSPLLVAAWFSVCARMFHWNLMQRQKTGALSILGAFSAIAKIGLLALFVGVWEMGIQGVVTAIVIAEAAFLLVYYLASQMHFKIEYQVRQVVSVVILIFLAVFVVDMLQNDSHISDVLQGLIVVSLVSTVVSKIAGLREVTKIGLRFR